ncbi:MAG: multiheme c-type cytochrome [Gammaproteobacteria bacterium]|nr:multiheme c-type cytochrome [Gammaproteobacteria bacterium]
MSAAAKRGHAQAFPRLWTVTVAVNLTCGSLAAPAQNSADTFVGSDACRSCHADEYALWTQSDHYRSMRIATDATVLGDFAGAAVTFHDVETRFLSPGASTFHVDTVDGSGERDRFPVRYTFGDWPLQQYLVDAGHGRLQAFGIAWDTRPADQGGQRWFHLQPGEDIEPDHPFHWTGHALNWASQCAACHSTNVAKVASAGVATATYSEVNVACEACHGAGGDHLRLVRAGSPETVPHAGFPNGPTPSVVWRLPPGEPIAVPDRPGNAREIDMCGGCHALRTALTDKPMGQGFHDAYRLELARDGLYFVDGQILEETFVLGSFLQSRMHARGVTCSDCHDPHSGAPFAEGNAVCARCHQPSVYDVAAHHRHRPGEPGSACVDCHMPARTYMGVDDRRDHAFTIPRPALSAELGVPNACTGCHAERSIAWAGERLAAWGVPERDHWARVHDRLLRRDPGSVATLAALVDGDAPVMVKATLLAESAALPAHIVRALLARALDDPHPLVRRGAVAGTRGQPPAVRWDLLRTRLDDAAASVRFEMGIALSEVASALPPAVQTRVATVFAEHRQFLDASADLAATQNALARFEDSLGRREAARRAYVQALDIEPRFVPALVDYADFLRRAGDESQTASLLQRALTVVPDSAVANAAFGLHLVRRGRHAEALTPLERAATVADSTAYFVYTYGVAQYSLGQRDAALETLRAGLRRWPWDPDLLRALIAYTDPGSFETQTYRRRLAEIIAP